MYNRLGNDPVIEGLGDKLAGLRVLIVEDESIIAMLIEEFLLDFGCEIVGTAGSLREAMEKAGSLAVQVAVLDVNLDGQVSFPAANVLLARGIPFVFATGYGNGGFPANMRFAPVLSKPFDQKQLGNAILKTILHS